MSLLSLSPTVVSESWGIVSPIYPNRQFRAVSSLCRVVATSSRLLISSFHLLSSHGTNARHVSVPCQTFQIPNLQLSLSESRPYEVNFPPCQDLTLCRGHWQRLPGASRPPLTSPGMTQSQGDFWVRPWRGDHDAWALGRLDPAAPGARVAGARCVAWGRRGRGELPDRDG